MAMLAKKLLQGRIIVHIPATTPAPRGDVSVDIQNRIWRWLLNKREPSTTIRRHLHGRNTAAILRRARVHNFHLAAGAVKPVFGVETSAQRRNSNPPLVMRRLLCNAPKRS
jgi:hypothetical protein